ncbi:hypothetical protein [Halorientalis salina]|uniref:hypothetical protein n=1 Tax=Halorientalis salina TaxID=2932266 RepID=UPI0020229DA0|nr:hypothetical protein [Halorientalis salina]
MKFPSLSSSDDVAFDDYDEFVPAHIPEPGSHLAGHAILTGEDHVAFHELTRDLFDERGVYDMTFGYNLARLNLDSRHTDAGYRYAESADESGVLVAEFTPTTEFCPQSNTLAKGSFRAWNGLSDRHEYDLVRVRVDDMHHKAGIINAELEDHERRYVESGTLPGPNAGSGGADAGVPNEEGYDRDPDAPF